MKLYLGIFLLLTGIVGLYLCANIPPVNFSETSLIYLFSEIKRNRMIMSIALMIAGLIIIIEHKK